jgi:hypothetical protein
MTIEQTFQLASAGRLFLPAFVALGFVALPRPRSNLVRSIGAVLLGWATAVFFTALVYNPAGIAYGHLVGQDFPEIHYDNNTVAVALIVGWLIPTCMVAAFFIFRWLWHRRPGQVHS